MSKVKKRNTDYPKKYRCPRCKKRTWRFKADIRNMCWKCYTETVERRKGERLYGIWSSMKTRCNNPKCSSYPNYGAMGIRVCLGWDMDYMEFRTWALSSGYQPGLTLERKDNNKGYCPSNCTWTTWKEQSRHRRNTAHPEVITAIKAMLAAGVSQVIIRSVFAVSKSLVSKIYRGKAWA